MSEDTQQAATHAKRAVKQSSQAAKNAGKAVKAVAAPVVDELEETAEKFEGTMDDAVDTARRINPRAITRIFGNTGQGFMALTVAAWAGTLAFQKFNDAYKGRRDVLGGE